MPEGEVIMMWSIRKRLLASVCYLMPPGIPGPLLLFPFRFSERSRPKLLGDVLST